MITLYKMNNTNNISWWTIEARQGGYSITWGQQLGGREHGHNFYPTPTPERATLEIERLIKHQKERQGYSGERPRSQPDKPMLAQKFDPDKFDWEEFYLQPKLDGLRCIATSESLTTRKLERITSVPNIEAILSHLEPHEKLDGELYIHGTDLQTMQSLALRNRPHKLHYTIEYHVYDLVNLDLPFSERSLQLRYIVNRLTELHKELYREYSEIPEKLRPLSIPGLQSECPIKFVTTKQHIGNSGSSTLISQYFKECIREHYEGCMVRNASSLYELDYRSPNLLKYKERLDSEFEIIDISEGYNKTGIFVCKTPEGGIFEATPAWTTHRKQVLLRNKELYIGRWLTVEYESLSRDNIPLKPVGKATREDKNHEGSSCNNT